MVIIDASRKGSVRIPSNKQETHLLSYCVAAKDSVSGLMAAQQGILQTWRCTVYMPQVASMLSMACEMIITTSQLRGGGCMEG